MMLIIISSLILILDHKAVRHRGIKELGTRETVRQGFRKALMQVNAVQPISARQRTIVQA